MKRYSRILLWPWTRFRKFSLKLKIITIAILFILLIVLTQTIFISRESGYITEPVSRATISQTVAETGNVDAGASIAVTSPSTGTITEIYVANGQYVNTGDILFKVQSSATEQERATAYSTYLTAVAALNAAEAQQETLRAAMYQAWDDFYNLSTSSNYETEDGDAREDERLAAEFQISQDNWQAAEKRYKDQTVAIGQAQAQVSASWLAYQATQNAEVKATTPGIVANLAITSGSDIVAEESALIITGDATGKYVVVAISEIDIPKIRVGQKVEIEIDAIDDEVFRGEVDRVDSVGINTQGVITYNIYIRLLESSNAVRTGMTASVEIATETRENVLSVPNSAVKPYQGGRAVQVLENGQPKYIPVRVGIRGDERTEIIEGLHENQEIIVGARNELIQRESNFGF